MKAFSLAVKPDVKPKSLVEILEQLPDFELMQLQRYASIIPKTISTTNHRHYHIVYLYSPSSNHAVS